MSGVMASGGASSWATDQAKAPARWSRQWRTSSSRCAQQRRSVSSAAGAAWMTMIRASAAPTALPCTSPGGMVMSVLAGLW